MARGFIVAGTTGLAFRDSIPMLGAKSACDPFPPYRRLHLYDTSVEFVFLVSEDFGGACACGAGGGGGVQVLAVSMGQVLVPTIALVVLAAILTGSFLILSYWVVAAEVSRLRKTFLFVAVKARD